MGLSAYAGVLTPSGEKRAEDFSAGDTVVDAFQGGAARVVKSLNSPGVGMVRVFAEGEIILDCTGDTAVLTAAGPVAAGKLAPGASLCVPGGVAACVSVEALMGDYMVYDLSLDGGEFVFAGGIAVAGRS